MRRHSLRTLSLAAALTVVIAVLIGVPAVPAGATHSFAGSHDDPAGDTEPSGVDRADILGLGIHYEERYPYGPERASYGLDLTMHVAEVVPAGDKAWDGDTFVMWALETDGDDVPDWFVVASDSFAVVVDGWGNLVDCPVALRNPEANGSTAPAYGITFDPLCIGGPIDVGYEAALFYDADGVSDNNTPASDAASSPHRIANHPGGSGPPRYSQGYYFFGSEGHCYTWGRTERLFESAPTEVVGGAATRDFAGCWLVGADGGVFALGTAGFFGSTGGQHLNQPIVGMAASPSGEGYWLVARDGGVFAFGDAGFHGSTGGLSLNQPIVGMAPTLSGEGYWLAAADGGVFAFGGAAFHGSAGSLALGAPITGIATSRAGAGYRLIGAAGAVFNYGDAAYQGAMLGPYSGTFVGIASA